MRDRRDRGPSPAPGERAALRALGLLDEREARFRARRRLCWMAHYNERSNFARLCPSLIDQIVPYFDFVAEPQAESPASPRHHQHHQHPQHQGVHRVEHPDTRTPGHNAPPGDFAELELH